MSTVASGVPTTVELAPGTRGLNVRPGPGTSYDPPIATLRPGQRVTIEGKSLDGRWVWLAEPRGWAAAHLLVDAKPETPARPTEGDAVPAVEIFPRGQDWRTAGSLNQLLSQVNAMAPRRRKSHDGTIGDRAHSARKSDHNPNARGVVTALDITHDPANGCDCQLIADRLIASRDPRIKYVIWRGKIASSLMQPWVWRPYTGPNKHDKHIHVSVDADPTLYDSTKAWSI
jgi:hypothetical protein